MQRGQNKKKLYSTICQLYPNKTGRKEKANDLYRHFLNYDTQVAKKHVKRYWTSLIIREMQIKTKMWCPLTSIKMITIKRKKPENSKCWQGCGVIGTLVHCQWECKIYRHCTFLPSIAHLDIHLKNLKSRSWRDIYTPIFITALLTIAKTWKQLKYLSTDEQVSKMWYKNTMESNSALKRKEILTPAATWINLDDIVLSAISQSDNDK